MRFIFYIFISLVSVNLFAYELQVQYRNYDVNDGLPSSQIYEIIEDSKGYIWFGTDRGLVRYNGYEFVMNNLTWEILLPKYVKFYEDLLNS